MRLAFVVLFLTSILAGDFIHSVITHQKASIYLSDIPVENHSEKESKDVCEEETKSDYLESYYSVFFSSNMNVNFMHQFNNFPSIIPFLEIVIPPPKA